MNLFGKELKKAISVLSKYEAIHLYNWALTFSKSQPQLNLSLDYMIKFLWTNYLNISEINCRPNNT